MFQIEEPYFPLRVREFVGTFMHASPVRTHMAIDTREFEHPAWLTAGSTVVGYLLIIAVLTAALFVVPWLVFAAL